MDGGCGAVLFGGIGNGLSGIIDVFISLILNPSLFISNLGISIPK